MPLIFKIKPINKDRVKKTIVNKIGRILNRDIFPKVDNLFITGHQVMKFNIASAIRRTNTGNLLNAITYRLSGKGEDKVFGLGDKTILETTAPYYYEFNYGKDRAGNLYIPPNVRGSFAGEKPDPSLRGSYTNVPVTLDGKFNISAHGDYSSKQVIPTFTLPTNFIQKTRAFFSTSLRNLFAKRRK